MPKKETGKQKKTAKSDILTEEKNSGVIGWFKSKPIRWIGALVILAVVAFVAINSINNRRNANQEYQTSSVQRGDLTAIVGATGIVEARQTVDLNWQTTGRVDHVYFKTNDMVKKGDILADLADNTLPQSVILANADLVSAKKDLADLVNSTTESAQKYQDLLQAEKELRTAEDNRNQWNYSGASWDRINAARDVFIRLDEELTSYQNAYDAVKDLPEDNPDRIQAKQKLDDTQFARDKALRELNYILGRPYNREVADDFASYDVAQAKLEDAQRHGKG